MKDFLRQQIDQKANDLLKRSLTREYLQARVLQALQDNGVFMNWAFLGGTALRFLYGIPRYSEDLDFSLVNPDKDCDFESVLLRIKSQFLSENYDITIKASKKEAVMSAFLKFPGILYEIGISPLKSETLSIKFEVDTNPPPGALTTTTITRRFVTVNINHYDKASLLAGKLHAILSRKYTKGRDLYDLVWYLSDRTWPSPNMILLNNALQQTGWQGPQVTKDNMYGILSDRITGMDWTSVINDLMPFLERPEDASLITKDNILSLLKA